MAPVEGDRKVLILHEFHLLRPEAAALLLKTIEEPPASDDLRRLADAVPPDLVTIASRCVRIDFRAIPEDVIADRLARRGRRRRDGAEAARGGQRRPRPGPAARRRPGARRAPAGLRRAAATDRRHRCDGDVADRRAARRDRRRRRAARRPPRRRGRRARRAHRSARRAGQRPQAARGTAQARAAPPPHRRAAQRARRAGRHVPRPRWSTDGADRPEPPSPPCGRIHGASRPRAQPERAAALQSLLWSLPVLSRDRPGRRGGRAVSRSPALLQRRLAAQPAERSTRPGRSRRWRRRRPPRRAVQLEAEQGDDDRDRRARRGPCARSTFGARRPPRSAAARCSTASTIAPLSHPPRPNASSSAGMPPTSTPISGSM